jgi:hypothetical protein
MVEQIIGDEPCSLRPAMAIIDAYERPTWPLRAIDNKGASLDLAPILEQIVGLHDGHGEVTAGVPPGVLVPEQAVPGPDPSAATDDLRVGQRGLEAGPHDAHHGLPHHLHRRRSGDSRLIEW